MYHSKISRLGESSAQGAVEIEQTIGRYLRGWCKLLAKDEWPFPLATGSVFCLSTEDVLPSDPLALSVPTEQQSLLSPTQATQPIASPAPDVIDDQALLELCTDFSSSVLECLLQFLKDVSVFDSAEFRNQLAMLISYYKVTRILY